MIIASSLIYFNGIAPQSKNKDFLTITKLKTSLYNHIEYSKTFFSNNYKKNLVGFQLNASCYSDVEKVPTNLPSITTSLDQLNQQQKILSSFNNEFEAYNYTGEHSRLFGEYKSASQQYFTELFLNFERQDIYRITTIEMFKDISSVCASDLESINSKIEQIETKIREFPYRSLESMSLWVEKIKVWINTTRSLLDGINAEGYSPEKVVDIIATFKQQMVEIFSVGFDYEFYNKIIDSNYSSMISKLQTLEEFEKRYIAENKAVELNTVFVLEEKK